ncbi:MAG: type II toxin-antitoxin system VapC family toxin [Pirellulaceae bacterium]
MDTIYIETTVIGHLVGRVHPDPIIAGRQAVTRVWWSTATSRYQLLISQLVIEECSAGDKGAAAERLEALQSFELLDASDDVDLLALALTETGAVPASEPRDAYHIAIAAVNGIKYLVTWNFKHIANAAMREQIEAVCRNAGFEPPVICTPDELLGVDDGL